MLWGIPVYFSVTALPKSASDFVVTWFWSMYSTTKQIYSALCDHTVHEQGLTNGFGYTVCVCIWNYIITPCTCIRSEVFSHVVIVIVVVIIIIDTKITKSGDLGT